MDSVNEFQVVSLGLRQRWQTKRGALTAGRQDVDNRRIVDLLTLDTEINLYPHKGRDNQGRLAGDLQLDAEVYLTDTVSLLSDIDFNLADGHADIFNLGLNVDRHPRMRFYIGNHYVRAGDSNALDVVWDYRATPRWDVGLASQYDFGRGTAIQHKFTVRRYFQAWVMDVSFAVDQGENDTIAAISFSPRGIPETRFKLRAW